jgi:hypothetical protein
MKRIRLRCETTDDVVVGACCDEKAEVRRKFREFFSEDIDEILSFTWIGALIESVDDNNNGANGCQLLSRIQDEVRKLLLDIGSPPETSAVFDNLPELVLELRI